MSFKAASKAVFLSETLERHLAEITEATSYTFNFSLVQHKHAQEASVELIETAKLQTLNFAPPNIQSGIICTTTMAK